MANLLLFINRLVVQLQFNIQNQNAKSSEISETVAGGYDADGNFNKIMTFNWSGHSSDSDQPPSYIWGTTNTSDESDINWIPFDPLYLNVNNSKSSDSCSGTAELAKQLISGNQVISFNPIFQGNTSPGIIWGSQDGGLNNYTYNTAKLSVERALNADKAVTAESLTFPPGSRTKGFVYSNSGVLSLSTGTDGASSSMSEIALGNNAGYTSQGSYGIAIGEETGRTSQGSYSVAIGYYAGYYYQRGNSVALGDRAGRTNQSK